MTLLIFHLRLQYLRMLAVAYEKTQELARELRAVGCGDLDVEGNNMTIAPKSHCSAYSFYYFKYILESDIILINSSRRLNMVI